MITLKELLGEADEKSIPENHLKNLNNLLAKANELRTAYGKPLRVTSGYRSMEKHLSIYAAKGITDKKKIPMKSKHLEGLAVDVVPIDEPIKALHDWIKKNEKLLEEIGIWVEDFRYSKTWAHLQISPPKSGKRFFVP